MASNLPDAPGPHGFTRLFFKKFWQTIKQDLIETINSLRSSRCANINLLNKEKIILILKKDGAEDIHDFRPINLIHTIAKIITKILALRLVPFINELISPSQSTFIKNHSIHDNFLYVRNLTRHFHQTKTPALLLKLYISKAFDSVHWDYLMKLMQHRLPNKIGELGCTPLICLNIASHVEHNTIGPIQHGRDLWQGDSLPPLLFILAIDPMLLRKKGCSTSLTAELLA